MRKFELPELKLKYDAFEPYIDTKTIEIHHDRHFKTYTDNFNKALEPVADIVKDLSAEEIIADVNNLIPEEYRQPIINNGGGYLNHKLYFEILGTNSAGPRGTLAKAIDEEFGNYENFKNELTKAALGQFGSGWAFLVVENGTLQIIKTSNQDSPLTMGKKPILLIDVWEHAYYLKYQNKRQEYVENFFNIIDWDYVRELYEKAL